MTRRLRVITPSAHGSTARVLLGDHDVSEFLSSVTVHVAVNEPNRATLTAQAFSVEDFDAEVKVRCVVLFGPFTGRGKDITEALHDMVERYDRAQAVPE